MLKSYLPGTITYIFLKRHYDNIFDEKLVYEFHAWIENNPNVIHSPHVSESLSIKINGTLVKNRSIYFKYQYESCIMI